MDIIAAVIKKIENSDFDRCYLGLRVIPDGVGSVAEGDSLPPSQHWYNDEPTGEYLDGTSAIAVYVDGKKHDVQKALDLIKRYFGRQVVLISGTACQSGEDADEIVLRHARVEAVLK